ncbi:pyridoxamine 5'-phosphate oxidase [bacterium]|nr:pyridoxamine 5'-phosphate oxidase [bacterium]
MKIFSTKRELLFFLTHPAIWFRKSRSIEQLNSSPFVEFQQWFDHAHRRLWGEFPNWCCLSTVDGEGSPDARIVLLKSFDDDGFVFYTNLESEKGNQLAEQPRGAMTFFWEKLQRQVRIRGMIASVSDEESDAYFATRPRPSQIGAWASLQSTELETREELEQRYREFSQKFRGKKVPRPPYWGGFRLSPSQFEFWELRRSRLHDRFRYDSGSSSGEWKITQRYP